MTRRDVNELIRRGIAAARGGRRDEAERLLRQATSADPQNARAWLWLSAVASGIEAQRECLYRVLEIEPHNSFARSGLAFLSRLRVGQEEQARHAPWVMGLEGEEITDSSPRRCARCGTLNPAWAYTCHKCAAALRPLDIVKTAQAEIRARERATAAPTVIESWIGALILNRRVVFEPELALASPGRALTALVLSSLFVVILRALMTAAGIPLTRSYLPAVAGRLASSALRNGLEWLVGAALITLLIGFLTFPAIRLTGGKGSLQEHFHMIAVAVSSWLVVAGVVGLLIWIAGLFVSREALAALRAAGGGALIIYAVVLNAQALQTAHRMNAAVAIIGIGGTFALAAAMCLISVGWETLATMVATFLAPFPL